MKIGLDVMGGDFAPKATIKGACLALKEISSTDRIVLFGPEDVIREELKLAGGDPENFIIVNAPEVIGMGEHPTKAFVQKPKSSISIGFHMLKSGEIDAFSSAGNSGAMVVGSMYTVNTIQGIIRPCTSAIVPKEKGGIGILLDVGTHLLHDVLVFLMDHSPVEFPERMKHSLLLLIRKVFHDREEKSLVLFLDMCGVKV